MPTECADETVACEECGSEVSESETISQDGDSYCSDCHSRLFCECGRCEETVTCCSDCGETISCDDAYNRDGGSYCEGCDPGEDSEDESSNAVRSYSYKPRPEFFHKHPSAIHYGVELEVNVKSGMSVDGAAEFAFDVLDQEHVYLKEDGSIGRGFEIVTHPHDLDSHRELWKGFTEGCGRHGISSYGGGTCGMHVHIERSKLRPLQLGKMLVFLNRAENAQFIDAMAQRHSEQWAKVKPGKKLTSTYSTDRYEALNLCNANTVELRIFRGNTRYDRIMKGIEFADAMVRFCGQASYRELGVKAFCGWVREHRAEYKVLDNYLVETGYLTAEKATKRSEGDA